jgi:hypothetical protein
MPRLRKVCHEKFAQAVAGGLSASEAYRQVSGNHKNADVHSDEWMKCRGVEERIMELRRENERKCTLSREAVLKFLAEIVNTPIAAVTRDSRLAQAMKDTDGVHEIRMPDKLVAVQTLARMCDWNSAERISVSADSLAEYIVQLRRRSIGDVIDLGSPAELTGEVRELKNGGNNDEEHEQDPCEEPDQLPSE